MQFGTCGKAPAHIFIEPRYKGLSQLDNRWDRRLPLFPEEAASLEAKQVLVCPAHAAARASSGQLFFIFYVGDQNFGG